MTSLIRARSEQRGDVLAPDARRFRAALRVADWRLEIASDSVRARAVVSDTATSASAADATVRGRLALELRFGRASRRWVDLAFDARALTYGVEDIARFGDRVEALVDRTEVTTPAPIW